MISFYSVTETGTNLSTFAVSMKSFGDTTCNAVSWLPVSSLFQILFLCDVHIRAPTKVASDIITVSNSDVITVNYCTAAVLVGFVTSTQI